MECGLEGERRGSGRREAATVVHVGGVRSGPGWPRRWREMDAVERDGGGVIDRTSDGLVRG